MTKFIPFYFEGNLYFQYIQTPEDVKELLKAYDYKTLRQAKSLGSKKLSKKEKPSFGFYLEYDGLTTLGEWIDINNQGSFFDLKSERKEKLCRLFYHIAISKKLPKF